MKCAFEEIFRLHIDQRGELESHVPAEGGLRSGRSISAFNALLSCACWSDSRILPFSSSSVFSPKSLANSSSSAGIFSFSSFSLTRNVTGCPAISFSETLFEKSQSLFVVPGVMPIIPSANPRWTAARKGLSSHIRLELSHFLALKIPLGN